MTVIFELGKLVILIEQCKSCLFVSKMSSMKNAKKLQKKKENFLPKQHDHKKFSPF